MVVERKSTNDQHIEARYYQARSSVNGMVVAKKGKPLQLNLADRQLNLTKTPVLKLKFSQYTNSFPIKQFTGEKTFDTSTEFFEGQSILYLRIPKNVQVTTKSEMKLITIGKQ